MAEHAHETLPRLQLLFAQRLAHVGEHEQLVRTSVLPERAAAHLPPAAPAGKRRIERARRLAFETCRPDRALGGIEPEQPLHGLAEQSLAGAIDQTQRRSLSNANTATSISAITRAQQRRRLERAQRCVRSVSPSAFTSSKARPSASSVLAPRARIE